MELIHELLEDAEFWVLIAFFIAIGVLIWKAKGTVTNALDQRAVKIRTDLDEAERLANDAQETLAQHQRRQRDALKEAEGIIALAKEEAERAAAEGRKELAASLDRRKRQAAEKLILEEQKASNEVRQAAVDVAIAALRRVLAQDIDPTRRGVIVDQAIAALPETLH